MPSRSLSEETAPVGAMLPAPAGPFGALGPFAGLPPGPP
ncbi:hypothetical protein BKA25_000082 [Actinoalloteichus hymeniacidonis]|nr:hypothetical protein [Actinoalloteichus hymeniacidonis]